MDKRALESITSIKHERVLKTRRLASSRGRKASGKILSAMPLQSVALVYGALSEQDCQDISPLGLIFEKKRVEGFWLKEWIQKRGLWRTLRTIRFIQQLVRREEFQTKIQGQVSFEQWPEALLSYHRKMSAGKMILKPNPPPSQ